MIRGNALAPNRYNSILCKVRTFRQRSCNQRGYCLLCSAWVGPSLWSGGLSSLSIAKPHKNIITYSIVKYNGFGMCIKNKEDIIYMLTRPLINNHEKKQCLTIHLKMLKTDRHTGTSNKHNMINHAYHLSYRESPVLSVRYIVPYRCKNSLHRSKATGSH